VCTNTLSVSSPYARRFSGTHNAVRKIVVGASGYVSDVVPSIAEMLERNKTSEQVRSSLAPLVQSTNTEVLRRPLPSSEPHVGRSAQVPGTQFTFFTSTKVQILTADFRLICSLWTTISRSGIGRWVARMWLGTHFTCFTGTEVQILTQNALLERCRRCSSCTSTARIRRTQTTGCFICTQRACRIRGPSTSGRKTGPTTWRRCPLSQFYLLC
jgi:hypothetical protein